MKELEKDELEREKHRRKAVDSRTQNKFRKIVKGKMVIKRTLFELKEQSKKKDRKRAPVDSMDLLSPVQRRKKMIGLWALAAERAFLMGSIIRVFKKVN